MERAPIFKALETEWMSAQRLERWYMVAMFSLTTALLFADQNLLAPNLTEAAETFGMTAKQRDQYLGGVISATFFLVGAPAAVAVGYLMDRCDRRLLLAFCVFLGEAPCLATALVTRFWHLLLTRLLTGIAVGGAAPIIYALLSDLYPPSERAHISLVVVVSQGAGVALGQALAGGFPQLDWRTPFVLVSMPALIVAAIMVATTRDPKRGAAEPALQASFAHDSSYEYGEHLTWGKFRQLLQIRTNLLVILQGLPGCLPWGMVFSYLNDYLQGRGLSKRAATLVVLLFGAGGSLGAVAGGVLGQQLYNWRRGALAAFTGISVWAGMPILFVLVNAELSDMPLGALGALSFAGGAFASVAGVNIRPLIMNANVPESRGIAIAFQVTLDDLGKGLGPALVAVLISLTSRTAAFNIAICGWLPCGLLVFLAAWTTARDEDAVQRRLAAVELTHLPSRAPGDKQHAEELAPALAEERPLLRGGDDDVALAGEGLPDDSALLEEL